MCLQRLAESIATLTAATGDHLAPLRSCKPDTAPDDYLQVSRVRVFGRGVRR